MSESQIQRLRAELIARPRPTDLHERRRLSDGNATKFLLDPDIRLTPVTIDGVAAEWTERAGADRETVVLYLHGGGYIQGSILSHRHLVAEIGRHAGCRTLALDYRLAPENPFPAPVEDTLAAYRFLLSSGIAPGRIALAGDSAGGGLLVAAMVAIRDAGLPLPACGWAISPWVDMEATHETFTSRAETDPTVTRSLILDIASHYLGGADPRSPLASPIHADLAGIAPLLIQAGSAETLLGDALLLAQRVGMAAVPVRLDIWPEMIHVWPLYHPVLDAGRRAIADGAAYVRAATAGRG